MVIPSKKDEVSAMTLKDIAQKAGVSMMTVSNVINGKHNHVSEKTIQKVNKIIEECGYIPNLSARTLTNKKSNIIGIIISLDPTDDSLNNSFENPYISTMIGTIEHELRQNGYYTMVRSISKQSDVLALLKNWNVDGIIFLYPHDSKEMESFLETAPCPVAMFDSSLTSSNFINVCSDDTKGLYVSTKYCIEHGHIHIAFVADYKNNPLLTNRFLGYKQALEEFQLPFHEEYVYHYSPSYEGGLQAGMDIATSSNPITAVVTTADICAIGIMEGARRHGYTPPKDLSIIGYDNLSLCQYTFPKLTSISQNITQKALLATKLLLEKIETGTLTTSSNPKTDVRIVERDSVISLLPLPFWHSKKEYH